MFNYCMYLQPHSLKGQGFKEALWEKRDEPPPEAVVRKAIKDGLPEPMQHKLADNKDTDYRLMTEEKFNDTLTTIELKDERERAAYKETQDEVKSAQANLRETSEPRNGINANSRHKQKSNRTNGRGTARFCSLCKNAGMPEKKYMSHLDTNCEDAEEMARRAMGGGMADQNKQVRKYSRKESKALLKKLNKMTSKNKKLLKMSKKKSSDSKEVRKLKRKFAECNSSSDDDSDDSDDASISSASDSDTD
jgi:hypothetical protein